MGGGAGIRFKAYGVHAYAKVDLEKKTISKPEIQEIDHWEAFGYQDGMGDIRPDLADWELDFKEADKKSLLEEMEEEAERYVPESQRKSRRGKYEMEIHIKEAEGVLGGGYTREPFEAGDTVEMEGFADLYLEGGAIDGADMLVTLIAKEDTTYWYADVFDFTGEEGWGEDDWEMWQEDLQTNYGK